MQQMNVDELIPHPRNTEFFDDMQGEKWNEFLESVKTSGIIEPIVITQDKVIVSGHQRVRACKELGIKEINCKIHIYESDDDIIKDLLETNIRQRGDVGGSAKKVGLRIKELERLYGIKNGRTEKLPNNSEVKFQTDLADQFNISVDTLNNYKKLTQMIPELEELVDTGVTTPTTALAIMRGLNEEEQIKLIESMDTTKRITQREVQKYINDKKVLEQKIKELESSKNVIQIEEKEKIIDNTDYTLIEKNNELKRKCDNLELMNKSLKLGEATAKSIADKYKQDSKEWVKLKGKMLDMNMNDIGEYNVANTIIELSDLSNKIMDLLENDLSPIKYRQSIDTVKCNENFKNSFIKTIDKVNDWCNEMYRYLNVKKDNIIDMED